MIDQLNSVEKQMSQQVLYDAENTPTVTSVEPNLLSVLGII